MVKKIAAVSCGVFLGIVIAFARAGAFPFWSSSSQAEHDKTQSAPAERTAQATQATPAMAPAPANQPEPNEAGIPIASFAPLVKRVMASVVNVSVVQQIKSGSPFGDSGDQGGPGDSPEGGRAVLATRAPAGRLVSSKTPSTSSATSSAKILTSTSSTGSARA